MEKALSQLKVKDGGTFKPKKWTDDTYKTVQSNLLAPKKEAKPLIRAMVTKLEQDALKEETFTPKINKSKSPARSRGR